MWYRFSYDQLVININKFREETIILLPEYVGMVMLSATVPNYMDFADWVG